MTEERERAQAEVVRLRALRGWQRISFAELRPGDVIGYFFEGKHRARRVAHRVNDKHVVTAQLVANYGGTAYTLDGETTVQLLTPGEVARMCNGRDNAVLRLPPYFAYGERKIRKKFAPRIRKKKFVPRTL